jgi:hypothetical protein
VSDAQAYKLVVSYDRNRNEYSLVSHNQTSEEAQSFLDQWSRHLREGISFVVLDQKHYHQTEKARSCRPCRNLAARSDRFQPEAKLVRSMSDGTEK